MYLSRLVVRNFRQFGAGDSGLDVVLNRGVTALVGRNDCGKSTVIDAVRYALLTRDQDYVRIQPEDFHIDQSGKQSDEISIQCTLSDLDDDEKGCFVEYLSYQNGRVLLVVNWIAKKLSDLPSARRWVDVSVRCGLDGTGPTLEATARAQLSSTYLRPLRDAEHEMSPGRGSRLSQILANVDGIDSGDPFDGTAPPSDDEAVRRLSLLGLSEYLRYNIKRHPSVSVAESTINSRYLSSLSLVGDGLQGQIDISEGGTDTARLRQILERLQLGLLESASGTARGCCGLGSNNLLYVACELLLLGGESQALSLLLIEEPEAHLHPQRQLRLMEFLAQAADGHAMGTDHTVQVILSTHSPNLASKIPLKNIVLLEGGRAFPLGSGQTKLNESDYDFLQRFLDVTKANLFFAHCVIIVEGDAEAILFPSIAKLLGMDLTEHGISIVNVGGRGLSRFSHIFQRGDDYAPHPSVPIACVVDMDVMPDCAPAILGLVTGDGDETRQSPSRRWKAWRHFGSDPEAQKRGLDDHRMQLQSGDGQSVRTFVSDHWTLEYDLAFCGLAEEVYVAAFLAKEDDALHEGKKQRGDVERVARERYREAEKANGNRAVLCSQVYQPFYSRAASKAIAAQYLAEMLGKGGENPAFDKDAFSKRLPRYVVDSIAYVTRQSPPQAP